MKRIQFVLLLVVIAGTVPAWGQVTVGSGIEPERAALLELKTQAPDVNNVTSKKGGLGLSRVSLVSIMTLEPFISTSDVDWINNDVTKIKEKHAGLVVYNLTTTNGFKKGVYVWNGTKWTPISGGTGGEKRYFYVPSFNIPLPTPSSTEHIFDLYAEYKKQFTKSGNTTFLSNNTQLTRIPSPESDALYDPADLDYVITYYDDRVLQVTALTDDGKMKYKVLSQSTSSASFLNVVFVVKE
ncbi:hypothetical protein [Parabacteroides sp. PF5-9]|uniref:hypothetical protein n=1 Tax=Parabacteroides sp. PF5-9 TaxID=1742404 RepID=UPI00247493A0|nr:hypothetical protein [Parabacteroides sp. PF5-9]MDH6357556.1 hypothetical protein [Parabacteroides sp. PF5-9]